MSEQVITVTLNPALDKTVTVPTLKLGGLNRVKHVRIDPGGKGINVARVLDHFQTPVTATGYIAGTHGDQLLQRLQQTNINLDFVSVGGETRTNLKIVDEAQGLTTEINESGCDLTTADLTSLEQKLEQLLNEASLLVLGGSLPQGVPHTMYGTMIYQAKSRGVRTILDADGQALVEGLKAEPYAIKPNLYELEQLVGTPLKTFEAIVRAGQDILSNGVNLVLVSLGEEGAILLNHSYALKIEALPITPVSTVGAGDAMVGALAYAIQNGATLEDIAAWTTSAGALTASKPGTQVCTLQETRARLRDVQMKKI
ncbi:1-phosphofructokinase [Caldalkalibacillus salinus]|uniref:1-phosphofructokinase n=1 Tax=Caldalkalibacillus salinus TaxID=2803787 RepID=UPI001924119F|nr:1-phosphofructokinase [Caldalkalibacillus salinus]